MAGLFRIESCLCRESSYDKQTKGLKKTSQVSRIRPSHIGKQEDVAVRASYSAGFKALSMAMKMSK